MLLDEVPCNINLKGFSILWGRSSGNWTDIKLKGSHLMMCFKPTGSGKVRGLLNIFIDKFGESLFDLQLPNNILELKLTRIYRCTVCIALFYESLAKTFCKSTFTHRCNRSSISFMYGHQIYGKPPEVLQLPQCNCFAYCKSPLKHLLIANKTKIMKLLKRVQSKLKSIQITVIVDIYSASNECINWLTKELRKEDLFNSVQVKAIEECRGLEFTALVTISNDTSWGSKFHDDSSVIDAWTRATSTLVVINLDGKYHIFSEGLKDALVGEVAQRAVEQEDISYSYLKQIYLHIQHPVLIIILFVVILLLIFLQHPIFTPFLLPLLLFLLVLINKASIIFSKNR